MADLELKRTDDDRRLYALEGVGTLRLEGWRGPRATADTDARSWQFARRGLRGRTIEATDAFGGTAGTFEQHRGGRGGVLVWGGNQLVLRPATLWRARYALADGDHELAVFDGKDWSKQPVRVTVEELDEVDSGLLLFAAFAVRGLGADAGHGSAPVPPVPPARPAPPPGG